MEWSSTSLREHGCILGFSPISLPIVCCHIWPTRPRCSQATWAICSGQCPAQPLGFPISACQLRLPPVNPHILKSHGFKFLQEVPPQPLPLMNLVVSRVSASLTPQSWVWEIHPKPPGALLSSSGCWALLQDTAHPDADGQGLPCRSKMQVLKTQVPSWGFF